LLRFPVERLAIEGETAVLIRPLSANTEINQKLIRYSSDATSTFLVKYELVHISGRALQLRQPSHTVAW
jgi:hypothetical protein